MSARMMRGLAAALLASLPFAALAGGALSICGPATQPSSSNVAVKYPTNSVTLNAVSSAFIGMPESVT